MFLLIFTVLLVGYGQCGDEPKFQVLTPNELMVELPHHQNKEVVTFRIGIKRLGHENEDVELGENDINKNRIFFYDRRLNLQQGDVVNYLLAFRESEGYQAQTGRYIFDGAYYKKRRQRSRRDTPTTSEASKLNLEDFEPTNPEVETRFDGPHNRGPHNGAWPPRGNPEFNPFGFPRRPPPFGPRYPNRPPFGGPNFGCNGPDMGHDSQRWERTRGHSAEYHCGICDNLRGENVKSSTTDNPVIDIRFAD